MRHRRRPVSASLLAAQDVHRRCVSLDNRDACDRQRSAGPRRFRLPITVGRMTAEHGKLRAEIVELSVER